MSGRCVFQRTRLHSFLRLEILKALTGILLLSGAIASNGRADSLEKWFVHPNDDDASLNALSGRSALIVIGTVESIEPRRHWVEVRHDDAPPSFLSYEEAEKNRQSKTRRDFFLTDVTVKARIYLREPNGMTEPPTIRLRIHGYGHDGSYASFSDESKRVPNFTKGERALLFLRRDDKTERWASFIPAMNRIPPEADAPRWVITNDTFGAFTELSPMSYLQNGDARDGGAKRYPYDQLLKAIKPLRFNASIP